MNKIHRSKVGTYHPEPENPAAVHITECEIAKGTPHPDCGLCSFVSWTIHDSRGYTDGGAPCDECFECDDPKDKTGTCLAADGECSGLSFAYVCLDGGDTLCPACFAKDGTCEVIDCDCDEVIG